MWDLPGPGIEPVSPALAGGFFTTEPSRKPLTSASWYEQQVPFWLPVKKCVDEWAISHEPSQRRGGSQMSGGIWWAPGLPLPSLIHGLLAVCFLRELGHHFTILKWLPRRLCPHRTVYAAPGGKPWWNRRPSDSKPCPGDSDQTPGGGRPTGWHWNGTQPWHAWILQL